MIRTVPGVMLALSLAGLFTLLRLPPIGTRLRRVNNDQLDILQFTGRMAWEYPQQDRNAGSLLASSPQPSWDEPAIYRRS